VGNPRNEKGWPKPQLAIPAPPSRAVRVITTRLALSMVGESNDGMTLAYLGRPPEVLSAEEEADLPKEVR
jgi:hypothetical protein